MQIGGSRVAWRAFLGSDGDGTLCSPADEA
jgi:hypothetical protein